MRKMFTRLFSLALFLLVFGAYSTASAQSPCFTINESDVVLLTNTEDPDVCNGGALLYMVDNYDTASYEFAFNLDVDPDGGWSSNPLVSVPEGVEFRIQVRQKADITCVSQELTYTAMDLTDIEISTPGVEHPVCYDDESGEITINFTGGNGGYVYYVVPAADWTGAGEYGEAYQELTNQAVRVPGKYYVAVDNLSGCVDLMNIANWDSATINNAPDTLKVEDIAVAAHPACPGGDGTVTVTVLSGGTPFASGEYIVELGGMVDTTVSKVASFDVPAGPYAALVKDSLGCEVYSEQVNVVDPDGILFDIGIEDVACADSANGVIKVFNITGPADSVMAISLDGVNWVTDGHADDVNPSADTIAIGGLAPNYYSLFVDNRNDVCDSVPYVNPNGTGNVIAVQSPTAITFSVDSTDATCNAGDGNITIVDVAGGSGEYEYLIDTGSTWVATASFDVPAGTYVVSVRDKNEVSCEISWPAITIEEPTLVAATAVAISPTCPGGNDGVINVTATGGNGTYQYSLDSAQWYDNNIFAVAAGDYTVYVKDPACADQAVSVPVMVTALEENVIVLDSSKSVTCFGESTGSIYVSMTSWAQQTDETRTITVKYSTNPDNVYQNGTALTDNGDSTYTVTGLAAGTYYVWAMDNLGCVYGDYDVIDVVLSEGVELDIEGSVTGTATCYGTTDGVMTIKSAGATMYGHANTKLAAENLPEGAFTAWPADADSVEIQVGKGTYWVVVKDDCGENVVDGPFEVGGYDMVEIGAVAGSDDLECNGDTDATIVVGEATGGSGVFTYTLMKLDGTYAPVAGHVDVDAPVFEGLGAGTYKVVVTDSAGCAGDETDGIVISEPTAVTFSFTKTDITCYGAANGTVTITAAGGNGVYEFKIGTTNWRAFPTGSDTKTVVITDAGTWDIMVRDTAGCEAAASQTLTIEEPTEIVVDVIETDVTDACNANNGVIKVVVDGGANGMYDVQIAGLDTISTDSVATFTGVTAGEYAIVVMETDSAWCSVEASATIAAPDSLSAVSEVIADVTCNGEANGSIAVSGIVGGEAPYTVTVGGVEYVSVSGVYTADNLVAGTYEIVVSDANGCEYKMTQTIEEPAAMTLNATKISDLDCDAAGSFSVQVTGGTAPYQYYTELSKLPEHILVPDPMNGGWQTDSIFTVDTAGTYIVWAVDANGCMIGGEEDAMGNPVNEWRVKIDSAETEIDITVEHMENVACNGDQNDTIIVHVVVTVNDVVVDDDYTVTINGVEGDTLANVGAGTYEIVVTSEEGCTATETVVIDEPAVLEATLVPGDGEFSCPEVVEGYLEATAAGGAGDYMYQLWQGEDVLVDYQAENSFLVQIGHTYTVVVKDAGGCTDTASYELDPVTAVTFAVKDVTCYGAAKASARIAAVGESGRTFEAHITEYVIDNVSGTETVTVWNPIAIPASGMIDLLDTFMFDNEELVDVHYIIVIADEMGCESAPMDLTFDAVQTPLEVAVTVDENAECSADVVINPTGGAPEYKVTVNGEDVEDMNLTLTVGTYEIVVTDDHLRCSADTTITVVGNPVVEVMDTTIFEGDSIVIEMSDVIPAIDTVLYGSPAGTEYTFEFLPTDSALCTQTYVVTVTTVKRVAPIVASKTPTGNLEDNHPTFEITFENDVVWGESGYLRIVKADMSEVMTILITEDMLADNKLTISYEYDEEIGGLPSKTPLAVLVDSGIVTHDDLPWEGVSGFGWLITTGEYATPNLPEYETVEFDVYPNPFNDFIRVKNADQLVRVVVSNIAGQRVLDIEYPESEIRTNSLVSGMYVVSMFTEDGLAKTTKVIKK